MLTENKMILIKLETIDGTDASPSATSDFLLASNLKVTTNLAYNETTGMDGSLSPLAGTLGQKSVTLTFDHQLQVNNSSVTVPPIDALLQISGWDDNEQDTGTYVDGKYWPASIRGLRCTRLPYTAGDGAEPSVGDTIEGVVTGETGVVAAVATHSGAWGVDAAGVIYLDSVTGPFDVSELLKVGATNFATTDGAQWTPSATIYVYEEDLLWKLTSCKGDIVWNLTAGEPASLSATITGRYTTPTVASSTFPSSWTDNGSAPMVAMGGIFTWNSENPVIEGLTFGLHNDVNIAPSISQSAAVESIQITNRKPEATMNPEVVHSTDIDYWGKYDGSLTAMSYNMSNGTVDVDISMPYCQITNIGTTDRNGILVYDIGLRPVRSDNSSGEDEMYVQFSAT